MDTAEARRRLGGALDAAGVLAPLARLRERWIAARAPESPTVAPDGLPLPPARLRVLVDGHGDPDGFLEDGRIGVEMIRATLADAGIDRAELGAVLDFGCGCGRIARGWYGVEGPALHGCDYNAELVEWCRQNLAFIEVRVNDAEPPAPYESGRFGLVYAVSIFTHLTERLAHAWMDEFARILAPGGLLLFTTHGDRYRGKLTDRERAGYDRGEMVVQRAGVVGQNACAAYHPASYVSGRLLDRFELLSHSGHRFPQDVYLVRLRG